jgi:hypothetical protein
VRRSGGQQRRFSGPGAQGRREEGEAPAKMAESGGGAHRERANGEVAAPNLTCSVVDYGGGVVKWH